MCGVDNNMEKGVVELIIFEVARSVCKVIIRGKGREDGIFVWKVLAV